MSAPLTGIDVSNNQGTIDWAKVAHDPQRIRFAFVKASEGLTFTDAFYARNRRDATKLGIPVGAYHYAHPANDPIAEAKHFLNVARPKPGDLRPALDLEEDDGVPRLTVRRYALWWLRYVHMEVGLKPLLYTYPAFASEHSFAMTATLQHFPLWIANYEVSKPTIPKPWSDAAFWQYSSSGKVKGVAGRCDMNRLLVEGDPLAPWRLP